jgi:hypothetical protein
MPVKSGGVALPLDDGLVVVTAEGAVVAIDAAGRRLWDAVQAGCTEDELATACVQHGALPVEAARAAVSSTLAAWRALGLVDVPGHQGIPMPVAAHPAARPLGRKPALDAAYLVGDRPVRVRCDDSLLGAVIDAACASCRVAEADAATATVDLIEQDGRFAVRAEGAVLARTEDATDNPALARHRCLTTLIELARPGRRWLGVLHASAVGIGGRCIVFPGGKGSGKSTLAAALASAGAHFVTDDYAPLEQGSWRIWPVPYAPGIKRGSRQSLRRYYPEIYGLPVHRLAGMQIRYLKLDAARIAPLERGLPVAALVFPRYQAGAPLEQETMSTAEALAELCHARSMLDRRPAVLAETLRWLGSVPAYRLTYGNLDRAMDRVFSLLVAG